MIKIAYIIDTIATPGAGTEKQLLMLLHGLDRSRFEPTLVCLRPSDWLQQQTFPFDVRVLNVGAILRPSVFAGFSRFKKLHREKRFDIAQTFFLDANVFGTAAAHFAGIRTIVSSRRNIGYWHTGFYTRLLRCLRRWTTWYLANSRAVVDVSVSAEGVSPDKITIIYNGLDLEGFRNVGPEVRIRRRAEWGVADDEMLVGAVANLRPIKNVASLVKAASLLAQEFPKVRFVVVGEGPDRNSLQGQIDNAGLRDRFRLVGAHTDIVPCLAAFDLAVLCSRSESFSGSLVEYMAAGLPITASNVGGNPEAITHGETGLLYEPDDGENLAESLRELLQNSGGAARMGANARKAAFERYSRETCIRKHEEFYERILSAEERR